MSSDSRTPEEEESAVSNSQLLLRDHIIGWGILGLALLGIAYAYVSVPPPGTGAYPVAEQFGSRAEYRIFGLSLGIAIVQVTVGGALLIVALGLTLKGCQYTWKRVTARF